MFITLLVVTFFIAATVTHIVARIFNGSVRTILDRVVGDMSGAWHRYVTFAIYVVGISGGVRIFDLEKYITPRGPNAPMIILSRDRWILEVYRTIIETLQSTAWMLLVFFIISLIGYGLVRLASRKDATAMQPAKA